MPGMRTGFFGAASAVAAGAACFAVETPFRAGVREATLRPEPLGWAAIRIGDFATADCESGGVGG